MTREAYRTLYGDLTKLKDRASLNDPAGDDSLDDELWELLASVSDWIDGYCDRHFYPRTATLYFDLAQGEQQILVPDLVSVTTLKDDENQDAAFENTWASADYQLLPHNAAPTQHWGQPYTSVRASQLSDGDKQKGFPPGQRVLEIAGVWGYREFKELSGSLAAEAMDATETGLDVDDGTDFAIGQTIMQEDEQMLITDISSNTLTVVRGLNGTTAATHADDTQVYILRIPAAVERAALITAARVWSRAPAYEPFYVDADVDTDVRLLLEPFRKV